MVLRSVVATSTVLRTGKSPRCHWRAATTTAAHGFEPKGIKPARPARYLLRTTSSTRYSLRRQSVESTRARHGLHFSLRACCSCCCHERRAQRAPCHLLRRDTGERRGLLRFHSRKNVTVRAMSCSDESHFCSSRRTCRRTSSRTSAVRLVSRSLRARVHQLI